MFGVFSSSPASVLGNPAELRRVLAEIAAAQPDLAINELTGWVDGVAHAYKIVQQSCFVGEKKMRGMNALFR